MVCSRMRRRMVSRALTSRWCRSFSLPSDQMLFCSRKSLWRSPPCVVGAQPSGHGAAVLDTREFLGQAQQLPGRLVARARAKYGADVGAGVKQAALHLGAGPRVSEGLADATASPIAHDRHGFGDACHQVRPCVFCQVRLYGVRWCRFLGLFGGKGVH